MRTIILILIFLILGALFIVSNNNLALIKQQDRAEFDSSYTGWLQKLFSNSQNLVGSVVNMGWFPDKLDASFNQYDNEDETFEDNNKNSELNISENDDFKNTDDLDNLSNKIKVTNINN